MARPSKYDDETCDKAREYLANFIPTPFHAVPMIAGLAKHLKVSRDTVYEWASHPDKAEFSDIVGEIMTEQEMMLTSGGLMGTYHATIAKLMLSKHGYTDKVETKDTTKKAVDDLTDEELDEYIAERIKQS